MIYLTYFTENFKYTDCLPKNKMLLQFILALMELGGKFENNRTLLAIKLWNVIQISRWLTNIEQFDGDYSVVFVINLNAILIV